MASVAKNKTTGDITIQFKGLDGKRKTLRLGKCKQRTVTTIKTHVEELLEAHGSGRSIYDETQAWLKKVGAANRDLYEKLAKHGLVPRRNEPRYSGLAAFLDDYIVKQSDKKRSTIICLTQCRNDLVAFFGADRALVEITEGDAEDWRQFLRSRPAGQSGRRKTPNRRESQVSMRDRNKPKQSQKLLQENTIRRRCGRARQLFAAAVRHRIIDRNPFSELKGVSVLANKSRDFFITREMTTRVLAACPDSQWKLLFALSRFGGLRCPSEHLALTWRDINWETGRITIRSPKTAHHEGKESRVIPLFPDLRPYLEAVRDEANPGIDCAFSDPVITRYRDRNANLRPQLQRIIENAGLTPWPKLFQNLRASRATELAKEHAGHVAAAWLGHSTAVAAKHYWQTTDDDFNRALQNALQQPADTQRIEAHPKNGSPIIPLDCAPLHSGMLIQVAEAGVEPARELPPNGF